MHIAQPAPAAFQNDLPPVVSGHIRDDLSRFQILNNRSLGNLNDQILSVGTVAAASFRLLLHLCATYLRTCRKSVSVFKAVVHLKNDIAAFAAVTAVGAAVGNI